MLEKLIAEAVQELFGVSDAVFSVEHAELAHGDFASNVALVVGKRVGKNPKEVAEAIAKQLDVTKPDVIASVSVAGPGFLNFTLAPMFFAGVLESATKEGWGNSGAFAGKKILVEHSSPNLFKPFHIGHLMNNTIGEAIVRLARSSDADVSAISYPSDISLGVAKAIFVLLEKGGDARTIAALGDAYVEGTKRYEEDESIQERVKEIASNLYAGAPSPEFELFLKCKAFNIAYFESVIARLGSRFDSYIYESEAGIIGKRLVQRHTPEIFTESEGAVVYIPEESKKLHTSVFVNSQGNPTYEAKDIGLLEMKFERYAPDLSIFITDNQQISHFEVVLDAAEKIHKEWKEKSLHRFHGRMSFKGQKMSSRLGGVPLAEEVLGAVIDEVKEKNPDVTQEAAEMIGIAALKFVILRAMAGKDINFDPETSLSFEGDSGPYLQYAAVRAGSILAKAKEQGLEPLVREGTQPTDVERLIARFPDVVMRATLEWAPHHIVSYLLELAQRFNSWYGNTKIIDAEDPMTRHRLAITTALRQTIKNGLWLLGISVPEKM